MFYLIERIVLTIVLVFTIYLAFREVMLLKRIIKRGQGSVTDSLTLKRLINVILLKLFALQPTWKIRPIPSLFHAFVVWGFLYYLMINLLDVVKAYTGFQL